MPTAVDLFKLLRMHSNRLVWLVHGYLTVYLPTYSAEVLTQYSAATRECNSMQQLRMHQATMHRQSTGR